MSSSDLLREGLRWVGLAGPTASGKTAAAMAIAERWPVEIVSVDSALVYREMDIGTAKPTAAERAAVPHHLIDVLDPTQRYSAAQFVRDAEQLIESIQARGRIPLLVGGTMLYFKALIEGLDALPEGDATTRAKLDAEAAAAGWPAMHDRLQGVDPITAARLAPNDSQRIQRALEVYELTGRPLSSFHTQTGGTAPSAEKRPTHHLFALEPENRAWLHGRIAERFAQMLHHGFEDEVLRLRARGDLHLQLPSMRCVGYRQIWEALDRGLTGTRLHQEVNETGVAATRQLAKRQMTWLRSMERQAISPEGHHFYGPVLHSFDKLVA